MSSIVIVCTAHANRATPPIAVTMTEVNGAWVPQARHAGRLEPAPLRSTLSGLVIPCRKHSCDQEATLPGPLLDDVLTLAQRVGVDQISISTLNRILQSPAYGEDTVTQLLMEATR